MNLNPPNKIGRKRQIKIRPNSEPIIAEKTHSEILSMGNDERGRWYKTILPEEKKEAKKIVNIVMRVKVSAALKGRPKSKETISKMSKAKTGTNHPLYGTTNSEETCAKRKEAWTPEKRAEQSEHMKGENNPMKRPDVIVKHKASMNRPEVIAKCSGEYHHNWQGGKSFEPYGPEFNAQLKNQIKERDNHTCQECHQTEDQLGYPLSAHHIDYDKRNNSPENLISLCHSCHAQTNFNREDWTEYFGKIMEGDGG